jgi:hypothetical protein
VGIDATPLSEAAIAFAFDAASARRAPLIAVHTWHGSVVAELVDWHSVAVEAEQKLAQRLAGWSAKYPDVAVQRIICRSPYHVHPRNDTHADHDHDHKVEIRVPHE